MTKLHRATAALVMPVLVMFSAVAEAQQPPAPAAPASTPPPAQRPFSGLFEGAATAPQDTASLLFSGYGGYDNDRSAREGESAGGGVAGEGPYTGADVDLSYTPRQRGWLSFEARGTSSLRYYTDISDFVAASQTGSTSASIHFSPRVSLQVRGGAAYTPYFDYTVLPGMDGPALGPEVPPRIPDNTVTTRRMLSYDGGVELTAASSERTTYSFEYAARTSELLDEGQRSFDNSLSADFSHRFNRRTTGRMGYVHRQGEYSAGLIDRPVSVDEIEFGVDRDWARSATRHTLFTFTAGPSVVESLGQRRYRGFGGVSVTHPFARSWSLRAFYQRGIQFVDDRGRPYFYDSGTLSVSGLVTRRLDLSLSAGAVLGDLGLELSTTPFDTYSSSVRFRYALTRTLAMYGEHLYNYTTQSELVGASGLNRASLRFGLSLYVPLRQEHTPRSGQ